MLIKTQLAQTSIKYFPIMHLAYSALRSNAKSGRSINKLSKNDKNMQLKYLGYLSACEKYKNEISAIQQYIPGWEPALR